MMNYAQQIKHPLWQKKRLEVLELHNFQCQECRTKEDELHVHHPFYKRGAMIWEYEKEELECLCFRCHKERHEIDEKIKKALAVCRQKPLAYAYICGLNDAVATVQKTVPIEDAKPRKRSRFAPQVDPPKEPTRIDPPKEPARSRYTKRLDPPEELLDMPEEKTPEAFFAKMKKMML